MGAYIQGMGGLYCTLGFYGNCFMYLRIVSV